MITISHDGKDPYRTYAIEHFIQKYGLSANVNIEEASIVLISIMSDKNRDQAARLDIQVLESGIGQDVAGYVKYEGKEIALFERAARLSSRDVVLATFSDGDQEYPCVTAGENTITIGFDLFREVGRILSGHLEEIWGIRDEKCKRLMQTPLVDCYEQLLFDCISLAATKLNISIERKAFWPEARPFALCLSHDVDRTTKGAQYLFYTLKSLKDLNLKGVWKQFLSVGCRLSGREPYWNFDRIMELESNLDVRSTLYFLNENGKARLSDPRSMILFWGRYNIRNSKIQSIISKLHTDGWEIGIHGSYNSYSDRQLFQSEKHILEGILGDRVYGGRQHYLNLEIPRTWHIHEEAGLEYDSTLGFTSAVGFRSGTSFPFFPFDEVKKKNIKLLEIPMTIMDGPLFGYSDPWSEGKRLVETVEKYGGVLVLNWHQRLFNPYESVDYQGLYTRLIKLCQEKNAWIATLSEVNKWWRHRIGSSGD